jgi:hypothetical protein
LPYSLIWEPPDGVCRVFRGHLTGREVLTSLEELTGSEPWDRLRYSIANYLEVSSIEFDDEALEALAAQEFGASMSNTRVVSAVVAVQPFILDAFSRFSALDVSRLQRGLFSNEAGAREWLSRQQGGWSAPTRKAP